MSIEHMTEAEAARADCPSCADEFGECYLNLGREQWGMCTKHKVCWCVGSNLFSSWKDEDETVWARNARTLAGYRVVDAPKPGPRRGLVYEPDDTPIPY